MHKFRTLRPRRRVAARALPRQELVRRTRDEVTPLGRWLRAAQLDEIPQFWNVLRGDMSFVGPRPIRPRFFEELAEELPAYWQRLVVRPGLTGLAQMRRGYETSMAEKLAHDLEWIADRSVRLYLRTLTATAWRVLRQVCSEEPTPRLASSRASSRAMSRRTRCITSSEITPSRRSWTTACSSARKTSRRSRWYASDCSSTPPSPWLEALDEAVAPELVEAAQALGGVVAHPVLVDELVEPRERGLRRDAIAPWPPRARRCRRPRARARRSRAAARAPARRASRGSRRTRGR